LIIFKQTRQKTKLDSLEVNSEEQKFTFRNKISNRRNVDVSNEKRLLTYPHGF